MRTAARRCSMIAGLTVITSMGSLAFGKAFVLPDDLNLLDAQSKTRASICNLFGNLREPIDQLARLYDMPRDQVISILLDEGLLEDKRQNRSVIKGGRRRTDH